MAKILVVDDEPDMIWALTNVLLSENHSVISVNSGEEALEKLRIAIVDLVLLDFRLPGMDGIQILERIKQMKPELPVIMVTGYGGIEEAVQSIKLGAAHYLPKPFDNQQLIEIVNKSLQLDTLRKEGVFGGRIAQKIDPRASVATAEKPAPLPKPSSPNGKKWIVVSGLIAALALISATTYFWFASKPETNKYPILSSKVSGLSIGGGYLWMSDWFTQNVYQYQIQGKELVLTKTYPLTGQHITGIAWAEGFVYTCDSWKHTISKHYLDNTLSVTESYPSPGPNPSALFYDGKYLWTGDASTRKIYQHLMDSQLTMVATYDSPALFPIGLYHDRKDFWSAGAKGMKIYRNSLAEGFKLEKTYVFPDSFDIAEQLSSFTLDKTSIWLTYEGVNSVFQKSLKELQEVKE